MNKELIKKIQKERPNLKINSINSYINSLKGICRHFNKTEKKDCDLGDLKFLNKTSEVFDFIKDLPITTQKNKLNAIVVVLKATDGDKKTIDKYSQKVEELSSKYNAQQKKQEKSEKQESNWLEISDIKEMTNKMFEEVKEEKLNTKSKLTNKEYSQLQNYILIRFYLKFPFRNDFASMKVIKSKKDDNKKDNFILVRPESAYILLNDYKTVKNYGPKSYKLQPDLLKLTKLLLKHNDSGFLFTKYNRIEALNSNDLTKLLNRIFIKNTGKKISSSMLRHIQISEDREGQETIKELEEKKNKLEDKYMHSSSMNNLYRKIE
tara:strand:+ start:1293 stop:2255 length:963 start_codon:yes stop_codon:yes gene_type:complete